MLQDTQRIKRAFASNEIVFKTYEPLEDNLIIPFYHQSKYDNKAKAHSEKILHDLELPVGILSRICMPRSLTIEAQTSEKASTAVISEEYDQYEYSAEENELGMARTYKVAIEDGIDESDLLEYIEKLRNHPLIESTGTNDVVTLRTTQGEDPQLDNQWGLKKIRWAEGMDLWQGDDRVLIGVIDTGCDLDHEEFHNKIKPGFDFVDYKSAERKEGKPVEQVGGNRSEAEDDEGHGTQCAGIAAANTNNAKGISGVCPQSLILPVRAFYKIPNNSSNCQKSQASGFICDIIAAMQFAIDSGAHVLNLSFTYKTPEFKKITEYAHKHKVALIAATGNQGKDEPVYPASNSDTLAVGAIKDNYERWEHSNYGSEFHQFVVAPGMDIRSTYLANDYIKGPCGTGTSFAAPFVTGLAALIISLALKHGKEYNIDVVYDLIRQNTNSDDLPVEDRHEKYGKGLIDVFKTLEAAYQHFEIPIPDSQ